MSRYRAIDEIDCIDLQTLLQALVDDGAESVYLLPSVFRDFENKNEGLVVLREHIPAHTNQTRGNHDSFIQIAGNHYRLDIEVAHDGMRPNPEVPAYVSDNWPEIEPVSVEEGVKEVRKFIRKKGDAR